MLCAACRDIFSSPRKLAYGSIRRWQQTAGSFRQAVQAGCHLCNLVHENASGSFSAHAWYSFKPLNPNWARHGTGSKWCAFQGSTGDVWTPPNISLRAFELDPTPNKLGSLLATESENLVKETADSWVILEFYGANQVVLPMELSPVGAMDSFDDLAQRNLASQTSTGEPETLQLARAWLESCLENHPSCRPRLPENQLPTRLIDVGSHQEPLLRLVSGASLEGTSRYVALSHRHSANMAFILTPLNLAAYETEIPASDISDMIWDAIEVTRALGIQYLWADCICIIHDDDGQDWAHEAQAMWKVYGLSTCTIAGANSGDENEGLFSDRIPYRIRPYRVPSPFKTNSKCTFNIMSQYLNEIYEKEVRCTEWFKQGWVFQERTLAPRLLTFTRSQVLWGCSELHAAETWPCGKTSKNYIDRFVSVAVEKARFADVVDKQRGIVRSHAAWWTFLQDYMTTELTVPTDRLPAIQGIAALVEELTGKRYCSGFWMTDDLPHALL